MEPEFPKFPANIKDKYNNRHIQCGEVMYEVLGIAGENKMQRIMQTMRSFDFFGTPAGLIISMDKAMGMPKALDIGIYMQSIMLLAQEHGLNSCPQVS